jgi:cytoskeletal protein CcmA (bactofilin family)
MIRMGRGNKSEPASSTGYREQVPQEPAYRYANEVQSTGAAPVNRAMSESDSMARDIKEGRLSGFVGHGTTLTGETIFTAMLRVDGHLIGNVSSDTGTLIVGTNGQVDANIMVAAAMVNGTVNGDIIATEKLQLGRTARVLGNIQSPKLIIEEGAILEGTCSMIKALKAQDEAASAAAAATQYEQAASAEEEDSLIANDDPSSLFPSEEENERSAEAAAT